MAFRTGDRANKVVCAKCGARGRHIDVRPNRKEQPVPEPDRQGNGGDPIHSPVLSDKLGSISMRPDADRASGGLQSRLGRTPDRSS
jgi:hypothetical protein